MAMACRRFDPDLPNKGTEPTPYSVRSTPASGLGSCPSLARLACRKNRRVHLEWSWGRILALELGVPVRLMVEQTAHLAGISGTFRLYGARFGTL
jgi:hypothetical protein